MLVHAEWAALRAQVLEGVQEGTLFDRNVVDAESRNVSRAPSEAGDDVASASCASRDLALAARTASRVLQSLPTKVRAGSAIGMFSMHFDVLPQASTQLLAPGQWLKALSPSSC